MARKTAATPAKKATKKTATKKTARKSVPQAETAPKRTYTRRKPKVGEEQVSQEASAPVDGEQAKPAFNTYDVDQIANQAFQAGLEIGEKQTRRHFADRTLEINGLSGEQAVLLAEAVMAAHDVEKYELLLKDAHAELRRRNLVAASEVPAGRYVVRGELVDVTPTTVIRQHLGQGQGQDLQNHSVAMDRAGQISGVSTARYNVADLYRG